MCIRDSYAGALPLWLAPVQVAVIPIADRHKEAAAEFAGELKSVGGRVEVCLLYTSDRPQGREPLHHPRRIGRGRPAGAPQDRRGLRGERASPGRPQAPPAGAHPHRHDEHPVHLGRRLRGPGRHRGPARGPVSYTHLFFEHEGLATQVGRQRGAGLRLALAPGEENRLVRLLEESETEMHLSLIHI